jgi:hypothetical protein
MPKDKDLPILNEAVIIAASVSYTKKQVEKLKEDIDDVKRLALKKPLIEYIDGPQGPQGRGGVPGPEGPTGRQGLIGPVGSQGPEGPRGLTGLTGPEGPQGAEGPQGPTGPKGEKGDKGEKGNDGERGLTGPQGPHNGPIGPQGPTGPQGIQGVPGAPGPTGKEGPRGDKGDTGSQGLTGPQGAKGEKGDVGPAAARGLDGAKGEKGDRGDKGEKGDVGPVGPGGPVGPAGKDADQIKIDSNLASFKQTIQTELNNYKEKINQVVSSGFGGGNDSGGGEIKLLNLQDVAHIDRTQIINIQNGSVPTWDSANLNFVIKPVTATASSGGSSSGYLANSIIFANTTGHLSNTNTLRFISSNNTLITGNVLLSGANARITFADGTSMNTAASGVGSSAPVTLVYANTVTPASSSKITYRMSLTANLTILAPSGASDGDQVEFWLTANGGARTVTFSFARIPTSSALTSPVTIESGTQGELMFRYDSTLGAWKAARFVNGYT